MLLFYITIYLNHKKDLPRLSDDFKVVEELSILNEGFSILTANINNN